MRLLAGLPLFLALLSGGAGLPAAGGAGERKPLAAATVFPLAELARAVAGDAVEVLQLLPPGADVHTWQPRVGDVRRLAGADLVVSIGSGLEPWLPGLVKGAGAGRVPSLEASRGLDLLEGHEGHAAEEEPGGRGREDHDPHVWLDFLQDEKIVDALAGALAKLVPAETAGFRSRAEDLKKRLRALDASYREGLSGCAGREIFLAGHAAFGYLARRYGLVQVPVYGVSPDAAPTPKTTAGIAARAKRAKARTIFYEPGAGDKVARLIAAEAGADVRILHPGHNITPAQREAGVGFFDLMAENLEALRHGLAGR
jgi:zinc transport system substrate-binding protein